MIVEFIEEVFSGYNANIQINYDNDKKLNLKLYRKEKNILSTGIININKFEKINSITVKYETKPEIIFKENINSILLDQNKTGALKHNNYYLSSKSNSIYNNLIIAIQDTNIVADSYNIIASPIKIIPEDSPFKNSITLFFDLEKIKNPKGGIFNYNRSSNKWSYMQNFNKSFFEEQNIEVLKTEIYSGGIFAVLNEDIKPNISNISPSFNSKYKPTDLTKISFKVDDKHSGVNHNSIIVKIDGEIYYYTYIPYRKTIECTIESKLNPGEHILEIYAEDNLYNSIYKKGKFYIDEK